MYADGAAPGRWALHLVVVALAWGLWGIARAARRTGRGTGGVELLVGLALLGATLRTEGIEGVRRWLPCGALRLHASALLAPLVLVSLARLARQGRVGLALGAALAVQCVHLLQPDAGQSTAFGLASLVLFVRRGGAGLAVGGGVLGLAIGTWWRADPLPPAPFVEDIVARGFRQGWGVGGLALLSLLLTALSPLRPGSRDDDARAALAMYFAASAVVTHFGEFPVPLLGFGPSPVIGAFVALGMLEQAPAEAGSTRPPAPPASDLEPIPPGRVGSCRHRWRA